MESLSHLTARTEVVSAGLDGTLRTWATVTGQERSNYPVHTSAYAVAYSSDGKFIATGGGDGVKLWNAKSQDEGPVYHWETGDGA